MTEREVQGLIVSGAKAESIPLFKIIDARGTGKHPFDISGVYLDGIGIGLEVKKTNKLQPRIGWSLFSPHQIIWLKAYAEANAYAILAVYYDGTSVLKLYRLTEECFSLPYLDLDRLKQVVCRKGDSGFYGLKELLSL
jgi:hypothetical protein